MRIYSNPYFGPAQFFHVAATCQVSKGDAPPGASPPSGSTHLPSTWCYWGKHLLRFLSAFLFLNLILLGVNFIMFIVYQPFSCLFPIETIEQGRTFFRIRFFLGRELVAAWTFIFIPEISSINENQVLIHIKTFKEYIYFILL